MKRGLYLPLMLVCLLLAFLAGNDLAGRTLGGVRLDLTQDGLYRLSDGSVAVLERLDEPLSWTFYYSRAEAAQYPAVRAYATRVRTFLDAYADRAAGRVRVIEIDPEPFSDDEDAALAAGLTPMPTDGGDNLFFGLVASNSVDQQAVIPLFREEAEARLEYDLTRLIVEIERPSRPTLAVLTSLPLSPENGAPNSFIADLNASYDLIWLDRDFDRIPEASALLILHPGALDESQLYLIDQFALARGRIVAFIDPLAHMALRPGPDGLPPLNARRASDLGPLLARWGVAYDSEAVSMDRQLGLPVEIVEADGRARRRAYPLWFALGPGQISQTDLATATLDRGLNFGSPGALDVLPLPDVEATALLQTSPEGALLDADIAAGAPGPDALLQDYVPATDPPVLALRVTGMIETAFPGGPPAGDITFNPSAHRDLAAGPVDIAIVADVDWLDDSYYVRNDPAAGPSFVADNLTLALNLIDMAAGDPALVSLRSRAPSMRPMHRVERLRAEAEARYVETQDRLEAEIAEAEDRLASLLSSGQASALLSGSRESDREEALRLRQQILQGREDLRGIERDFRRDIDALNADLQFWTIGVPPALVILIGVAGTIVRRRRRRA